MWPLTLAGPDFLAVFFAGLVVAGLVGLGIHALARTPSVVEPAAQDLNAWELAWLRGGRAAVVETALAGLYHRGAIAPAEANEVRRTGAPAEALTPGELEVYAALGEQTLRPKDLVEACDGYLASIHARLRALGLVMEGPRALGLATLTVTPWLAVVGLGVAKIDMALERGRPFGFLALLTLGAAIAALVLVAYLASGPRRTLAGDAVLDKARSTSQQPADLSGASRSALRPEDVTTGMALFGLAALNPLDYGGLKLMLTAPPAVTASGDGGGCSGGGCGGGCGGCGGCGD